MSRFLAVDTGNTHTVLGLFREAELERTWRLASDTGRTEDEYRIALSGLLREADIEPGAIDGCMISSVVPVLTPRLRGALGALIGRPPDVLTHRLDLGFAIRYQHPEDVGADRLANAVGGLVRYGAPLIVVDLGTATTFDVVSAEPAYLGGVIMPGLEMSAEALGTRTALLPRIAPGAPESVIGRTTVGAIASGLVWGTVGAVDGLIERVREELGEPHCALVATGGLAALVADLSRHLEVVDPDLTLFGIQQAWRRSCTP